ncbi:MAG TPA: DNA methyltransferase, partial [Isosphaeraceae bacterium]|nr:DNA methyltransferase [Isosphaeraceae bacterium]
MLAALFELLKGFEAADEESRGQLLSGLRDRPDRTHEIYEGLLTVLMRLVFLLYAEEREMFPADELFVRNYALSGLFARLVEDEGHHPDTMDQRYGAWAQLISLFRMVHGGTRYQPAGSDLPLSIPARHGDLFKPERFPFLEGRADRDSPAHLPRVPDGTILNVLRNLLYLKEERLSYRSLEVEQIGSVYEAVMGYRVETATGRSVAIRPEKRHGAPVTIDLDALLALVPTQRGKRFKALTDRTLPKAAGAAVRDARNEVELVAALDRLIDRRLTPAPVPAGSLVFQPSPERRRTGSHYTPRSLTKDIVVRALKPILDRLGPTPAPDDILALKICDPAMGSGAFLIETMRLLARLLCEAWARSGGTPRIPGDETPDLFACRLIAQRCLYGVDKNRMAVDLAKLSFWLATLAKDHAFTFLDHNLRHGDSVVGLSLAQIEACHWSPDAQQAFVSHTLRQRLTLSMQRRMEIMKAGDLTSYEKLSDLRAEAETPLEFPRFLGDAILGTFFEGGTATAKERRRNDLSHTIRDYLDDKIDMPTRLSLRGEIEQSVQVLRRLEPSLPSFHWEIEFPEVFLEIAPNGSVLRRETGGFDVMVGNPPFAGKNTIAEGHPAGYLDWLKTVHAQSHGNADLVAHFFRRAFNLIRQDGAFGLIATNTI